MRGFVRTSVAVPVVAVADPVENAANTLALWQQAHDDDVAVVVFPELGLSSYTARDLFLDDTLLAATEMALATLVKASSSLSPLALVGLPLRTPLGLYNVAVAIQGGRVLGAVPKAYLPNYREFEEKRWFREGREVKADSFVTILGERVPFGTDLVFSARDVDGMPREDVVVGVEICEDFWVQVPPSSKLVGAGATIICNLSASNFTVGKADLRRLLARSQSERGKCAYLYVAAGPGESSTDLAFDADAFICEGGSILAESKRFSRQAQLVTVDIDVENLRHERTQTSSFGDCAINNPLEVRAIPFTLWTGQIVNPSSSGLRREVARWPFIPADPQTLATRAWEVFEIQTNALATRLQALTSKQADGSLRSSKLVLGISGGLDSTQAALEAEAALDMAGRPRTDLIGITMPGLGTSTGTKDNALKLGEALGATMRTVGIAEMSRIVLGAVGHPATRSDDGSDVKSVEELIDRVRKHPEYGDATLENVQARLRTLVLMTVANQVGGLVVGTGDLSEKALGWSTYSGDHISMYDVNAGVPKTLIQFVIRWVANERVTTWTGNADKGDATALREVLFAILDTPISPELLPTNAEGAIAQLTEERIGPYELHDFYLFHFVRIGRSPSRILDLALHAFGDRYTADIHRQWLTVFLRRFFSMQFKRSCTADGPKVGIVALSPRGDWRMPSDARVRAWLDDVAAWQPAA